jgi:hypothetical protein
MSNHPCLPQLFYSGSWHVLTPAVDPDAYALTSEKTKITRGFADIDAGFRPSSIKIRVHDPLDKYRPTNPMSPLYGLAGRNTTLAVSADGSTRAVTYASSFRPDQSEGFTLGPPIRGQKWIDITGEGMLRQIGLWTTPLRSPIYRDLTGMTNLLGYWPLEDAALATQLSNAVPNGLPGTATGVTFEGFAGAAGSDKVVAVSVATGSSMSGKFLPAAAALGWQVCFSVRLPATPTAANLPMFTWRTSNGYTWSLSLDSTTYTLKVLDKDGATLATATTTFGVGAEPGQWIRFRCQASVTAGTVTANHAWYPQQAGTSYGSGVSFAGSTGALISWQVTANANNDTGGYGHVVGVPTIADDFLGGDHYLSFNGYIGELAAARFVRLCTEENIPRILQGSTSKTWPMGRQPVDTFLNLLKEVAATEDALIFDIRTVLGLQMRTRTDRYNQASKLDLTFGVNVAVPLEEIIDDVDAHNVVTANQRDGGDLTVSDTTSPMGAQAPPGGIGEYKQTVDVNVASEGQLGLIAGWWLNKGTIPGARYKQITVDLDAPTGPGLLTAVNSVDIGDRITLAGRTPDVLGLIVIGIDEEIETMRRRVTFTTVPDDTWNPARYGVSAGSKRRGVTAATTNGTMTTTSTTLTVNLSVDWFGTQYPYDLLVAGERMTVTAAAAGGGATQALTVTRSVNGVVKTHAAGEAVQIHPAQLARYGL